MKNNIVDYFEDLNANKTINNKSKQKNIIITPHRKSHMKNVRIEGCDNEYFIKESDKPSVAAAIVSANMYNEIGLATPQIKYIKTQKPTPYRSQTIQQNISNIPNLNTTMAKDDLEYMQITKEFWGNYKWEIFYNISFRMKLLSFMTKECFDQFTSMFLVDELRTDGDRHNQNFFLYKYPHEGKYNGVIAIDNENMEVLKYCTERAYDFDSFLVSPYSSMTPQQTIDRTCYAQRVKDIRELIQDGVLSQANIETLQAAINYDLPKEVKKACREQGLFMGSAYNNIVTPISKLHEYNHNTIGKDLGL